MQHKQRKFTKKIYNQDFLSLAITGLSACSGSGDSGAGAPDPVLST